MSKPSIVEKRIERPLHTFTVPTKTRKWPDDPSKVSMVGFSLREEADAALAAERAGTGSSLQAELVRRSVKRLNGEPVKDLDWFENVSPGVRLLIGKALNKLAIPSEEEEEDFFASEEVELPG